MATLQVKQLPDDLHAALKRRAEIEGTTLSEYVTRVLRRELSLPLMTQWLQDLRSGPQRDSPVDVLGALDAARDERS